jgi:hypothetical protein
VAGAAVARTGSLALLADAGLLAACFGLAGLLVPWCGLLFACAAGQLAGRLVPLPGGPAPAPVTGGSASRCRGRGGSIRG